MRMMLKLTTLKMGEGEGEEKVKRRGRGGGGGRLGGKLAEDFVDCVGWPADFEDFIRVVFQAESNGACV